MRHMISLGGGVQSSTMALMAAHGEIGPMPECAIFADTGWEPQEVYDWLDWIEKELPFPVYRTRTDSRRYEGMTLRDFTMRATMRDTKMHMPLPLFVQERGVWTDTYASEMDEINDLPSGREWVEYSEPKVGMTRRKCTRDWKIRPIDKLTKQLLGFTPGARLPTEPVVSKWIGISLDEIQRVKPSREKWQVNRHPLALELQLRRKDCIDWMKAHGYPEPPRSACIGCPYHDDYEWWRIKQNPEQWADAVDCDERIRNAGGMRGQAFLHHSGRPLVEAVPDDEPTRKRGDNPVNLLLFNECEGMCGV